jgi:hypothetical protein
MSFPETCKRLDAGIDGSLSRYITKTKAIEALMDFKSRALVAVGLKGIGKSSAFRYLTEIDTPSNQVTIGINPDKFALHLIDRNLSYTTYRKQFEHDIVVEALGGIIASQDTLQTQIPGIKQLIESAKKGQKSYFEAVKRFVGRGIGASALGFGINLGKADGPVLVGLRPQKDVRAQYDTLVALCNAGVRVRIVVDDPEQVFSASRDLNEELVGGFCLAAIVLSDAIPNLKIIALLKTHIYQPVLRAVDDLTRYPDHTIPLRWTPEELLEVLQRRIRAEKQKWTDLFEGTEEAGKQLIRRELRNITRNGPRDLLRTLDIAFQKSSTGKIGDKEIVSAREKGSQDSLDELTSAYNSQYPQLGDVVSAVFRGNEERSFTTKEFREHIQTLVVNDPDMKALSTLKWLRSRSSKTLPELFFEVGVLALDLEKEVVLPYEEKYKLDEFRKSKSIKLVPALKHAVAAG